MWEADHCRLSESWSALSHNLAEWGNGTELLGIWLRDHWTCFSLHVLTPAKGKRRSESSVGMIRLFRAFKKQSKVNYPIYQGILYVLLLFLSCKTVHVTAFMWLKRNICNLHFKTCTKKIRCLSSFLLGSRRSAHSYASSAHSTESRFLSDFSKNKTLRDPAPIVKQHIWRPELLERFCHLHLFMTEITRWSSNSINSKLRF